MGNYNSQYENYYKNFTSRTGSRTKNYNEHNKFVKDNKTRKKFVTRRIIQDLTGVFIMLIFVVVCKFIVTPKTTAAYSYCREVVNTNIDCEKIVNKIKSIKKDKNLQDVMLDCIEKAKVKFTGGETIKQKIKEKFTLPTNGKIKEDKDELKLQASHKGKVVATYDGVIKECGASRNLGNYVLIDHGAGLESEYYGLNNVLAHKGKKIKKGDIIAENHSKDEKDYVGFKILFMGQNKGFEKILGNKD